MSQKHYTIPIFIPEMACPFQCVFCNQRKITGKHLIPDDKDVIQIIESHLNTFKELDRVVEVGFFGGSFTGIPCKQQEHYLDLAAPYIEEGRIQGIRVSTRPDYIDEQILMLLKSKKVTTIELGAQSMDDEVLKASFRGHTADQTEIASQLILDYGFDLGLQMMIGLPSDSISKAIFTAEKIVETGASSTRIYPVLIIRDTSLAKWFNDGKYDPLSLEEAIQWSKQLIPVFENNQVTILRIGLHPSEGLLSGDELVAGPFHPSFRELVMTEIWADLLEPLMDQKQSTATEIRVPEKEINYAIGYNGKNKKNLLEYFGNVRFVSDPQISQRNNFQYHLYG